MRNEKGPHRCMQSETGAPYTHHQRQHQQYVHGVYIICCFPPTLASRSHSHANGARYNCSALCFSTLLVESDRSFCFGSTNRLVWCGVYYAVTAQLCICAMNRVRVYANRRASNRMGACAYGTGRNCMHGQLHVYFPWRVSRPDPDRTQLHTLYAIPNYIFM